MEEIHKKLQSHTILIVEDDSSTLKWLVRVLSIYFKKVYGASDAMEALDIFNTNQISIVLSDIQMPNVDGLNFLQKIMSLNPSTLRIIMTAFNNPTYINRAIQSEVNFYLKKPIDIDDLLLTIALNLNKKPNNIYNLGEDFFYDIKQKVVTKDKKTITLTKKEILFIELLLKKINSVITIQEIENYVWNEPTSVDAIRMVLVGLRKKLYPKFVENIKGIGYKLII